MSIKFKVIERGQPGVVGGGEKKYYASATTSGDMSLDDLTKSIEEISTISGADIRGTLYAMVSVMNRELANGRIVRLGDLGSLRMSISSKGEASADEVTKHSIRSVKPIFTPGSQLKDAMKLMEFKKVQE